MLEPHFKSSNSYVLIPEILMGQFSIGPIDWRMTIL